MFVVFDLDKSSWDSCILKVCMKVLIVQCASLGSDCDWLSDSEDMIKASLIGLNN